MAATGQSAMPRLARYFDSDRYAYAQLLKNLVLLGVVVGILGIALAIFVGPAFLRLVYPDDYAQYATVFTWLMAAAAIGYVASMLGYGMTAARGFRSQVPLVPDAVAVTALACWFSIPRLELTGSAYAVLIGSVSCVRAALFFFSAFGASHWCVAEFPNGLTTFRKDSPLFQRLVQHSHPRSCHRLLLAAWDGPPSYLGSNGRAPRTLTVKKPD